MANSDKYISQQAADWLAASESLPPKENRKLVNGVLLYFPYQGKRDKKGLLTAGRGHVIKPGEMKRFENGLTIEQINALFREDLKPRVDTVRSAIRVDLKQHQFDALVIEVYKCGGQYVYGDIGEAINGGEFFKAVMLMCTLYIKTESAITGKKEITDGMIRRRIEAAWLFHTGEYFKADTAQRRDILLRRLVDKKLLPATGLHMPDWGRYPKTGYPA